MLYSSLQKAIGGGGEQGGGPTLASFHVSGGDGAAAGLNPALLHTVGRREDDESVPSPPHLLTTHLQLAYWQLVSYLLPPKHYTCFRLALDWLKERFAPPSTLAPM